jgi:hypothetical protein
LHDRRRTSRSARHRAAPTVSKLVFGSAGGRGAGAVEGAALSRHFRSWSPSIGQPGGDDSLRMMPPAAVPEPKRPTREPSEKNLPRPLDAQRCRRPISANLSQTSRCACSLASSAANMLSCANHSKIIAMSIGPSHLKVMTALGPRAKVISAGQMLPDFLSVIWSTCRCGRRSLCGAS